MNEKKVSKVLSIEGHEYNLDDLSETAKMHVANIQFVDEQIQQLNNEWAVADTARIGYTNAIKNELSEPGRSS
jgi:hypothetical protein